jgi:hypothetical protein
MTKWEVDVRLSGELRGLFGGRKYAKAQDLTREILLEYATRQGAVTEVDLRVCDCCSDYDGRHRGEGETRG